MMRAATARAACLISRARGSLLRSDYVLTEQGDYLLWDEAQLEDVVDRCPSPAAVAAARKRDAEEEREFETKRRKRLPKRCRGGYAEATYPSSRKLLRPSSPPRWVQGGAWRWQPGPVTAQSRDAATAGASTETAKNAESP